MNTAHARQLARRLDLLAGRLQSLKLAGYDRLDGTLPADWMERLSAVDTSAAPAPPAVKKGPKPMPKPAAAPAAAAPDTMDAIRGEVGGCVRCPLNETRTNTVFGVGNPSARIMFVGEAPGAHEDQQGEPFVGRAGQLLTDMIAAMGFARGEVYIANIIKCRPPGNRDPLPSEVEQCEPYLRRQIALVGPEVIVALGRIAAQTLLKTDTPIGRLRGEWHDYHGTPLLPTYHPAYLLRNPASKREAWEDLKLVLTRLGLPVPDQKKKR